MTDLRTAPVPELQTTPLLPDASAPDIDAVIERFLTELDAIEAAARAATPQVYRVNAWAPWSMETGLSRAQEDFVDAWSPQRILDHCQAQRRLACLLRTWARSHPADTGLVLAVLELTAP